MSRLCLMTFVCSLCILSACNQTDEAKSLTTELGQLLGGNSPENKCILQREVLGCYFSELRLPISAVLKSPNMSRENSLFKIENVSLSHATNSMGESFKSAIKVCKLNLLKEFPIEVVSFEIKDRDAVMFGQRREVCIRIVGVNVKTFH